MKSLGESLRHQPSGKVYGDVLFRLAYRAFDFFIGLREVGAVLLS